MKINQTEYDGFTLDVSVFSCHTDDTWAQRRYLVHGVDDVLWTDDLLEALEYLGQELRRLEVIAPDS